MNSRRTKEKLEELFKQQGLNWVREQLETSGGEINQLETPFAKVWVRNEVDRCRRKESKSDKREERIWNLIFLLMGASISAWVSWQTISVQLAVAVDPVIEVLPSNNVIGKKGQFELSLNNAGVADLYSIDIYLDYFVTETLSSGDIQLVNIPPSLTLPTAQIKDLKRGDERGFKMDINPALAQMKDFYNKKNGLQMWFVRLIIDYRRKPDGKKFEDMKAYIIDLSGNVLMEEQDRGIENPYRLSFSRVKRILGVKE